MNLRKRFAFRDRKGFALILVFSLASIVLLLALSLVSLTQVESASSRYDQGLRVARANARLALQMAVGDLQEFAGPDQRITAIADGARKDGTGPVGTSFNDDANAPAISGVYQPFWTGVWDNENTTNNPIWLVTRPLDATYDLVNGGQDADPLVSELGVPNDLVKLVGNGSAKPENPGTDQAKHDVYVPREPVGSTDIVGMDDSIEAAIGHYAYWVGDNGVKASYLLEDSVPDVVHDSYSSDDDSDPDTPNVETQDQNRLLQMVGDRNYLKIETREMDATDARIGSIVNDFALREKVDEYESLLGSWTHNDVLLRFHDASALSRGLLVDTERGGLRRDLSVMESVDFLDASPDVLTNETLMSYLNVGALSSTSPRALTREYAMAAKNDTFGSGGPSPSVAPVLTGMKLAVRIVAEGFTASIDTSGVEGQLEFSVRLWNPYTSAIETTAPLVFKLKNPHVALGSEGFKATYVSSSVETGPSDAVGFSELMAGVTEFEITAGGLGERWKPGETRLFIGVLNPLDFANPNRVILTESSAAPTKDSAKLYPISGLPNYVSQASDPDERGGVLDKISFDIPSWTPEFDLELDGAVVCEYRLELGAYVSMNTSPDLPVSGDISPNIAYVWEIGDPRDLDEEWLGFDPRGGELNAEVLSSDFDTSFKLAGDAESVGFVFFSSAIDLLGYNDVATPEVTHNIPLFELPRQEFLSLGALHASEFPSGLRSHLGMSSADSVAFGSINDVFDRYFLSTVPQLVATDWEVGQPLPNGRMEVVSGAAIGDVQDMDSAEHLYLGGAFNINSTSVEAWASLLKGIRLGTWEYDDGGVDPGELDLAGSNQFLRFSQSAEETWQGTYASDADGLTRERFRKGLNSYTDTQMAALATEIVKGIRARRHATTAPMGPFVSLQDFIDSGVIQTAIAAAGLNIGNDETYTSNYLTQQDVLTAIAPFLSARSDTFVVRAYGDAVNPFDDEEILARAYCEAIVQRTHAKHATESNSDPMLKTDDIEGTFGRQFKIIAFRWMTGDQL